MQPDYYAVLGLSRSATREEIRHAYRGLAKVCHPDRGGSADQMAFVNEAWYVLSDPARRGRYDSTRQAASDAAGREAVAADVRHARRWAQEYPREWSAFEAWLNGVVEDVRSAEYGEKPSSFMNMDMNWPTVAHSVSGWVFIVVGGALGLGAALLVLSIYISSHKGQRFPLYGRAGAVYFLGAAWIGAQAGKWLHARLRNSFLESAGRHVHPPSVKDQGGEIVTCPACHRRLRVLPEKRRRTLQCPSCGQQFVVSQQS